MAHESKEQNYLITISLVILAFVALAVTLVYTRTVMIPFVVALFIVSLVSPVQDFQVKRLRFPRVMASIVTLLVVFFFVALVSVLVALTIDTTVSTAKDYSASMAYVANLALTPLEFIYQEETPAEPPAPNEPGRLLIIAMPARPTRSTSESPTRMRCVSHRSPSLSML